MKVDGLLPGSLARCGERAAKYELMGYDGVWSSETTNDPFLPLVLATEATERVDLGTSIAVAFARNPMTLASTAHDLQTLSRGRFVLGLGSQVKAHIERRFSMPWSHPAPRMREFILAMRAIWGSWNTDEELDFRGEFYAHTLMTPFFRPEPSAFGPPRVFLAGVGELMTTVAGEVADGFICHSFTTERYLREMTLPALMRGRVKAGKSLEGFEVTSPGFVVTGANEQQMSEATRQTKERIAFYGSTPAYRGVLDLHGWGELQEELTALSKRGRWTAMADLINDDVLNAFAVVAEPDQVAGELERRYGDVSTRFSSALPYKIDRDCWSQVLADLRTRRNP